MTRPETEAAYRSRAEELRSIAESLKGEETREMVLRLAADYDHMAECRKASTHERKK